MPTLTIRHVTAYRYRQPVAFGEHRMMLRPRDAHDQRVIEARLEIVPEQRPPPRRPRGRRRSQRSSPSARWCRCHNEDLFARSTLTAADAMTLWKAPLPTPIKTIPDALKAVVRQWSPPIISAAPGVRYSP